MYFTVIVGFLKSLLYIKFRQNEQKIAIKTYTFGKKWPIHKTWSMGELASLRRSISPNIRSIDAPWVDMKWTRVKMLFCHNYSIGRKILMNDKDMHLSHTSCSDLNRTATLNNFNRSIGDWTSPQMLQHILWLKLPKLNIYSYHNF